MLHEAQWNCWLHIETMFASVSAVQRGPYVEAHQARHVTHWTLLRHLDIALFMLVTVLSAAAVTFCDSVLAPFLQVELFLGLLQSMLWAK